MAEVAFDKMLCQMEDEQEGAMDYIRCAISVKEKMPDVADMYIRMATTELEHANTLHDAIKKFLEKTDASKELWAVWDWQNDRFMEENTNIRLKMEMARK